jgi:hypothetical protein
MRTDPSHLPSVAAAADAFFVPGGAREGDA